MATRVLVPLDGTARAEAALAPALTLADESGAEMVLMRVVPGELAPAGPPALYEAAGYLAGVAGGLAAEGRRVTIVVHEGEPADEIVREARDGGANLVIVAAPRATDEPDHRRGLADELVRRAPCPVLLFRMDSRDADHLLAAAALGLPGRYS